MNEIWNVVHRERRSLVRDLETVALPRWETPSLCPGWDVHDVLAHLVDDAKTTRLGFVRSLLAARFDFDRSNAEGVRREKRRDPALTLAEFRAVADRTTSAPAAPATRLVEAFVHGEDIRRPLGIAHAYPPEHVATALDYQLKISVKFGGGRERAAGLRLVAEDCTFEHGEGAEVRGSAIVLLLTVSGRRVQSGELAGPGAAVLAGSR